ncbi:MAG TPA: hypothetical protein DCZ69_10400 [Syntrophobacteraceae bacterium]|nr:hypothetical protein [Syntrophobacteraceae bacterium]
MPDVIPTHCTVWHLIIRPREIHFLRFILEAYEGVATLTTLEPKLGLIRLNIARGCEGEVEMILKGEEGRLQYRFMQTARVGSHPRGASS